VFDDQSFDVGLQARHPPAPCDTEKMLRETARVGPAGRIGHRKIFPNFAHWPKPLHVASGAACR